MLAAVPASAVLSAGVAAGAWGGHWGGGSVTGVEVASALGLLCCVWDESRQGLLLDVTLLAPGAQHRSQGVPGVPALHLGVKAWSAGCACGCRARASRRSQPHRVCGSSLRTAVRSSRAQVINATIAGGGCTCRSLCWTPHRWQRDSVYPTCKCAADQVPFICKGTRWGFYSPFLPPPQLIRQERFRCSQGHKLGF